MASLIRKRIYPLIIIVLGIGLFSSSGCVFVRGQRYHHFTTATPLKQNHTLVLGFLGGRESWNNPRRNVRRLALKLRAQYPDAVRVETVEIDLSEVSWMKKIFRSAHTRMDFDPEVWAMVEELIVKEIERLSDEGRD
jgi:hypothetical protein